MATSKQLLHDGSAGERDVLIVCLGAYVVAVSTTNERAARFTVALACKRWTEASGRGMNGNGVCVGADGNHVSCYVDCVLAQASGGTVNTLVR